MKPQNYRTVDREGSDLLRAFAPFSMFRRTLDQNFQYTVVKT